MKEYLFSFGDVIWCDRTFETDEYIDERHKHGPYIVLEEKEGFIYGLKGRGMSLDEPIYANNVYIDPYKIESMSKLRKKTEFRTDSFRKIPKESFINYIGKLSDEKKDEVYRRLTVTNFLNPGFLNDVNINYEITLSVGDIIGNNEERYLIIEDNDPEYYRIFPYYQEQQANKFFYRFDLAFDIPKKDDNLKLIGSITSERKVKVLNRYFQYNVNKIYGLDEFANIKVGSVLLYKNEFYYVCTIESGKHVCYKLYDATEEKHHLDIEGRYFKIEFDQQAFDFSNERPHLVINLNEAQINHIRELKKLDKVHNKQPRRINAAKRKSYNYFGKIITQKRWPFLKLGTLVDDGSNWLTCVDLEKLEEGKFELVNVMKHEVYYDKSTRADLINLISNLTCEITDQRYREFLVLNGLYDQISSNKGSQRVKYNKKDI